MAHGAPSKQWAVSGREWFSDSTCSILLLQATRKVAKCGYLFVAPGWDFTNPLNRTKVRKLKTQSSMVRASSCIGPGRVKKK